MSDNRYRKVTFFKFKYFICVCIMKYLLSVHTVSAQKSFGETCSSSLECTSNMYCISTICQCADGYYYNSSSDFCFLKKPRGSSCSSSMECTSNLNCTLGICDCVGDFYYDSSSSSCLLKRDHGAVCRLSLECKPSNTVCTSYFPPSRNKCLCADDFFWVNNRSCNSKSNLKITANIIKETRTVIFVWHDMSQRNDVGYYIRWDGSYKMNAADTEVTVTGLEPGTLHNFSSVTTLPGDGNYQPITVVQPLAPLWTRPDRPGQLSEVRREADSTYKITFGQSNGTVFLYTMSVSTRGFLIETQSSTSTVMHFTQLKPATTYSYILESYNGNSEKSAPTIDTFITDPEVSGPVVAFSYRGVQSRTANVTWQPPSQPNGNITGYLVEVALQNTAGCLYYIKTPCYGCEEAALIVSAPTCPLKDANITSSSTEYNLQLPNLTPYRNYTATVRAVSETGLGEQATVTFQTYTSAPNAILDLTVYSVRDNSTQQINLNIVWTPGDQTGPTDYYILVQEAAGLDATEHNQNISPLKVTGYSSTTYVKSDVLAYWNYIVSVWAQTDKGNSSQKSTQNRTVENYPGAVQNLHVTQDATVANIVTLTFACPEIRSRNGSIEQFVITQTLLDPQGQDTIQDIYDQGASNGQSEPCSSGYKVVAKHIMVERVYSFTVMTVNNKYKGGVNHVSRFYVQPKDDEPPVEAIVGGVLGGLALIAVIGVIVCLIRMTQSRREIREPNRENQDTQVTSGNRHTPKQTFSGNIELPQLRENSRIYNEISNYDYITEESIRPVRHFQTPRSRVNNVGHSQPPRSFVNNVRHSQPPRSRVTDVRSHRDVHQGIRDSQFPYENEVYIYRGQDYIRY